MFLSARVHSFSTKHQVLKNSVHDQISIDFEAISFQMSENSQVFEK
jgi:hypothetical protein